MIIFFFNQGHKLCLRKKNTARFLFDFFYAINLKPKAKKQETNLGGGIDGGLVLEKEAHHVDLTKVAGSVQWGVASLGAGVSLTLKLH